MDRHVCIPDINTTGLVAACKLLYKAGLMNEVDQTLGTYQYDLVDVGRQCLANIFCDLQKMVMVAYVVWFKDKQNLTSYVQLQHLADVMLEVLLRLDSLLQSNTNRDNVGDHATKHWAGLVDSYSFSCWNVFFQYVTTNVFKRITCQPVCICSCKNYSWCHLELWSGSLSN